MTQAFNLSQFANKLNTSGQTDNTGLQNSSLTVTAGTGMSGGGSVALGSSVTLTNAGVTSVTGGSGISVSASTGSVTISSTGGAGTVTSVATGNGLSGGTITTSGTLVLACPTANSVGSYAFGYAVCAGGSFSLGSNYSAGSGTNQMQVGFFGINSCGGSAGKKSSNSLSGTWKWMGASNNTLCFPDNVMSLICRVS